MNVASSTETVPGKSKDIDLATKHPRATSTSSNMHLKTSKIHLRWSKPIRQWLGVPQIKIQLLANRHSNSVLINSIHFSAKRAIRWVLRRKWGSKELIILRLMMLMKNSASKCKRNPSMVSNILKYSRRTVQVALSSTLLRLNKRNQRTVAKSAWKIL